MTRADSPRSDTRTTRPATLDDVPTITALVNASQRPFVGRDVMQEDEMRSIVSFPTNDLTRDSCLILVDGVLVGAAFVIAHDPFDLANVYVIVPPQTQREAIGQWTLDAAATLVSARAELHPDTSLLFEAVPTKDAFMATLLTNRGAQPQFLACEMSRDLTDIAAVQWPSGFRITTLPTDDETALYQVGETNRVAFLDHDGDQATPVENFVHMIRTMDWVLPQQSLVAWADDQPVGLAVNGADRQLGDDVAHVGILGVHPSSRGQGLGRALLLGSFAALRDAGYATVTLNVEIDNRTGADKLYRSAGMTPSEWSTTTWGLSASDFS